MPYVEAQLNSRCHLVDVLSSRPGRADEIKLQFALVYAESGSDLNHIKNPSLFGRGVRVSSVLEHQSVDLVDHSGSRPEIRFSEAVERRIHQLIGIRQCRLIR